MIRLSAALVVAALGVLIAGVATSRLLLVYVAIGISAAALLVLAVGVVLKRDELFAEQARPVAVPAGVGGSAYGDSAYGDSAHGAGAHGGWPSSRPAQQAPAQQAHDGTPARPGAWPPPVPGFPAAPAAANALSSPAPSPVGPASFRRPPAPPTRADPVLPWSDSLPTRVDIGGTPLGDAAAPDKLAPMTSGTSVFDKPAFGAPQPAEAAAEAMSAVSATEAPAARPDAPVTSPEPDSAQVPPSWLDDVDDDLDSGTARRDWLTADEDAEDADPAPDAAWEVTADDDEAGDAVADSDAGPDPRTDTDLDIGLDHGADPDADLPGLLDDDDLSSHDPEVPPPAAKPSATGQVTVVPGVPRYHDEDCILIRFMADGDVQHMTMAEAEKAGCTPCRACQPE